MQRLWGRSVLIRPMKSFIFEPNSTIISIKMSSDMSVVKKYWWKNMLPWIVSFLSGRTNSIGKANACQTQIKLRNQVCVDSIKKTFYQIVCSEEKLFLCSCQTETYSNWKQYFSSSIAERSGKTGFYWPVLIRSFQFGGERTPNMQYRRKNQMSPDLFPSQDSTTLKSQKWFLHSFISISSS